jgi:hypothetical protein
MVDEYLALDAATTAEAQNTKADHKVPETGAPDAGEAEPVELGTDH